MTLHMAEAGGRAIERKLTLPVTPAAPMIGVKPLFAGASLGEAANAAFDVVLVAPDGKTLARSGLRYELLQVETRYQWYRQDGSWNYEPIKQTKRVADGTVDVAADKPGRISVPVTWGRYRLEVSSPDGTTATTVVSFDSGFYAESSADTPDLLETALDKPEYSPGDTMVVAVTARTAGKVMLNIIADRLDHHHQPGRAARHQPDPRPGRTRLGQWRLCRRDAAAAARRRGPAHARPRHRRAVVLDRSQGEDARGQSQPARAVAPEHDLARAGQDRRAWPAQEARLVVAAVDVGILNLTNYKPPAPDDYYLGQRRLTADVRDLYGQLIDGMQATRGQIRSGGDAGGGAAGQPADPAAGHALFRHRPRRRRRHARRLRSTFRNSPGTVRVMAVAWSKDKVGRGSGDVTVRDPRRCSPRRCRASSSSGDRSAMQLELDNVEGPAGDYRISVAGGRTGAARRRCAADRAAARPAARPARGAADGVRGRDRQHQGADRRARQTSRSIATTCWRQSRRTGSSTRRTVRTIAAGESLTLSGDMFADLVPGTGGVAISVGPSTALDAATLLKALDRYPFGCSEQIASRALPLLYVNELAVESQLALDTGVDQRIRDAIDRLLARQGSNGSFGLWSVGGDDAWLDAYVTDFLTRARERGFAVPDSGFKLALDRLRNFVSNAPDPAKDGGRNLAYALYVLARNGVAPVGDLRYIADTKLGDVATPIAKAQIAGALGLLGDRVRAERVYAAALEALVPPPRFEFGREDYGSSLRDAAAVVMLAAEGGAPAADHHHGGAAGRGGARRGASTPRPRRMRGWCSPPARSASRPACRSTSAARRGRARSTATSAPPSSPASPLKITNTGDAPVRAVVSVNGAPVTPEPAAEKGFKLERLYYTLDGKPANPAKARQNQRFAVVLKITEPTPQYGRIVVADYLPAGFEIDNPRLVSSGDTGTLDWIEDAAEPVYSEFRDDHFGAAFDRNSKSPAVFTVAYVVRAVSPGTYVQPQAFVEDMYRPDRFGRTGTGTIEISAAR